MNKLITLAGLSCLAVMGCSSKPKMEAPECPSAKKASEVINQENAPPVVSDDGRFTYLKFGTGQEVPNFTALRIDGKERAIDHSFNPDTRIATIFGIYQTIVLRAGERVACIRNAAYDPRNPQSRNVNVGGDGLIW